MFVDASWDWFWLVLICINLIAFSFSAGVYGLMVSRWVRRNEWALAFLNCGVLGVSVLLVFIYLLAFNQPLHDLTVQFRRDGLANGIVFLLIFLPAVTRMMELRREHVQDARASELLNTVREQGTRATQIQDAYDEGEDYESGNHGD